MIHRNTTVQSYLHIWQTKVNIIFMNEIWWNIILLKKYNRSPTLLWQLRFYVINMVKYDIPWQIVVQYHVPWQIVVQILSNSTMWKMSPRTIHFRTITKTNLMVYKLDDKELAQHWKIQVSNILLIQFFIYKIYSLHE